MNTYNQPEAGDNPSKLVTPEAKEEPFVVTEEETRLVKIASAEAAAVSNDDSIGFMKGGALIPDDFDRMGEDEILALFEGDS
jgi:hypothetical protein